MRSILMASLGLAVLAALALAYGAQNGPFDSASGPPLTLAGGSMGAVTAEAAGAPSSEIGLEDLTRVVQRTCVACHNDQLRTANLSLSGYDVARATEAPEVTEKMIGKLILNMMPPKGVPAPQGDTMEVLVQTLESLMDEAGGSLPNPGFRSFQRLNRSEYEAAIRDLLGMEVDAARYLPQDSRSANFDNIADVQMLSPMVLDAYLTAAADISLLAVGDANASPAEAGYRKSGFHSQWDRVEGAPYGTRGGISVVHHFPADGYYRFRMAFDHTTTGEMSGDVTRGEDIDISINGEQVALLAVDQFMDASDPNTVEMESEPVFVRAGPQRVSAAFVKLFEGPVQDLLSAHDWSIADRRIGGGGYGITALTHMKELRIAGPYEVTGVSENPVRERLFTCRPASESEARPCAAAILSEVAVEAFRRPLKEGEVEELLDFYDREAVEGGFEAGVRVGLQAILASPSFIFRLEPLGEPLDADRGIYRISDLALASRLSYFLWGTAPDRQLVQTAAEGRLSAPEVLESEVRRMLADPRSEALATRFAAQWLRLHDLDNVNPDRLLFPDYHQELAHAMRRETELLVAHIVQNDLSVLDVYRAEYTFVNEVLARHYGIADVSGDHFRMVPRVDPNRFGILGHSSILTLTSHAGRTSPVDRGKWIMSVLLNTPPPPPPPDVPPLEEIEGAYQEQRRLTVREQLAMHRANPACSSCHNMIDPIGIALENFDVTGRWRVRDNGEPVDARGELWDGTPVASPGDLRQAFLERPDPLLRTFTMNMMAYALGRRVEYYDWPTIRNIVSTAAEDDHRMSSYVMGIVNSLAFQTQAEGIVTDDAERLH